MSTPERERALKIASVALSRARSGDLTDAASYVRRLNGSNGLLVAIVGWIDTYIATVYPEHKDGQRVAVRWLYTPTGTIQTADDVDAPLRWAGRLISMRAANDEDGFYSVLNSASEGAELGDGIMALLHIVATGLNDPQVCRDAAAALTNPSAVRGERSDNPNGNDLGGAA